MAVQDQSESLMAGYLNGRVETIDEDELQLAPYDLDRLVVGIDGKLLSQTGPLLFKLPDHLDTGSPAPDTFYYLYVSDAGGGAMQPVISATPPVDRALPGMSGTRYAGEFYTDASTQIVPMDHNPLTGEYRLLKIPWDVINLTLTIPQSTYVIDSSTLAGKVPQTVSAVVLQASMMADDIHLYLSHVKMAGESVPNNSAYRSPASRVRLETNVEGGDDQSTDEVFWLPVDGAKPACAWATSRDPADAGYKGATITVMGWRSIR